MKNLLKMTFGNYISRLSDNALDRRLGKAKADAYRNGELDETTYHSPARGGNYTLEELRSDDKNAFDSFFKPND